MAETKKVKDLTGVERSAVLLMSLGEDEAAEVLKLMSPKEVQKIGEAMAVLGSIGRETVDTVLAEFCDIVDEQTDLGIGNEDYLRNLLVNALGEDKASSIIDRILMGHDAKGWLLNGGKSWGNVMVRQESAKQRCLLCNPQSFMMSHT